MPMTRISLHQGELPAYFVSRVEVKPENGSSGKGDRAVRRASLVRPQSVSERASSGSMIGIPSRIG